MTEASSGMRNTVTPPAATSTEAVCWLMASAENSHTGDGHDDGKRRRAVEGDGEPLAHVHGARLASRGEAHEDGQRAHEQQKEDEQPQKLRLGSDGPHVHLRPGRHEEQRHEETVGDGVVLHLHGLVALRNEIAQDEAGGEGTEHDIQIEDGRNSRQADDAGRFTERMTICVLVLALATMNRCT